MSARIAPEPIAASLSPAADYRPRGETFNWRQVSSDQPAGDPVTVATQQSDAPTPEPEQILPDVVPPLPSPPAPPGTMFAAAVMAGALSPKPVTPEEILLRLGSAWVPPDSDLHLADRTA